MRRGQAQQDTSTHMIEGFGAPLQVSQSLLVDRASASASIPKTALSPADNARKGKGYQLGVGLHQAGHPEMPLDFPT